MEIFEPITVIWNPSSGSEANAAAMMDELRLWRDVVIERPEDAESSDRLIAELGDSSGLLVAAGGDGTVRGVVDSMMRHRSRRTLGILPLGTGNDLCRTLEIPFEPAAALAVLKTGTARPLDVLEFRTESRHGWCGNMITGGNTGRYMEIMTDEMKSRWGAFCYLRGVVDVVQNLEAFDVTLTCDRGRPETFTALNVFIANGRMSGAGLLVSPDAQIDDGLANVVIVKEGQPGEIARLTANYFLSDFRNHDLIALRTGREIRLEGLPELPLTCDGDSLGSSPLDVIVKQAAISVQAPPVDEDAAG